ncbi:MAG: murein biosynthesis integral membrane protein MurJ [Candidatus Doudnabacteria bacterium]|nr:murein biosynthesis integral membrane protein MurJ [Candidatus Doudnabacteria bacterium]
MIKLVANIEKNFSVSKAALIVGFFTLASRLMGLVRDRLFASKFGAGDVLDAYYAAFRVPDFVFNLLILGTLSIAFIPVFSELLVGNKQKANDTASTILNSTLILMSAVCLLLFLFVEPLTKSLVPGFSGQKLMDTISLTRLFLLSPIIFTVSNVFTSMLNAQKKFLSVGLAPILYNCGIIFGLLALYPKQGIVGLGYGVILGASLHLAVQLPETFALGFRWRAVLDFKDAAFRKMTRLFLPKIFGLDNSQISLLIGSMVGSLLASGSVAILNLANNLQAVPLGIFALSISVASFPALSESFAKKDSLGFLDILFKSVAQILFFILPIAVATLLLRAHIVRLVYGTGQFTWEDTILTFKTLGIFSISLFSQSLSPLLGRAFYARQNTIIPVLINSFTMTLNAFLAFYFGKTYGVAGIAAGFSASSILNLILLFAALHYFLHKDVPKGSLHEFDLQIFRQISKIAISALALGFAMYGALYAVEPYINTRTAIGLFVQAGLAGIVGGLVYLFVASSLKLEQAKKFLSLIKLS